MINHDTLCVRLVNNDLNSVLVFNKLRSCAAKEDIEECVSDVFAARAIYIPKPMI